MTSELELERRRCWELEEKLLHAEARLRVSLESSNEGILIVDDHGKVLSINKRFTELWHVPQEIAHSGDDAKLLAHVHDQLTDPDEFMAKVKVLYGSDAEAHDIVSFKDGRIFSRFTRTYRLDGEHGRIWCFTDITEFKRYEQLLRLESEKNLALLRSASDGVHILDPTGYLIEASDSFCAMLGYQREELIGKHVSMWDAALNFAQLEEKLLEQLKSSGRSQFETKHRRKDGSVFDVEVSGLSVLINNQQMVFNSSRDISFRRESEARREQVLMQLQETMKGTLQAVASMVEMRDPYTAGHERRVGIIAADIAREMGWTEADCEGLRLIGMVHDVGQIGIPAEILIKPTKLNGVEIEIIKEHPEMGFQLFKNVRFFMPIAEIIRQHHERLDGSGYPRGLRGEEILREARVIMVADVLEAMSSHRPYRPAFSIEKTCETIESGRGKKFDSAVVDAMMRLIRDKGYQLPR